MGLEEKIRKDIVLINSKISSFKKNSFKSYKIPILTE